MDNNFVTIKNLHFSRKNKVIFDGIDINIERGKITAIMGPSGTGKTTLLQLIGGQLEPSSGYVNVDGSDIHKLSRKQLYQIRRKMGMLFQRGALFTNLSVFENVAFPIREHTDLNDSMIRDLVLMKLEAVGLRGARDLMPSQLSGGMERRVALARAVALDPEIIMYDEPCAGQDPISMGVLVKLIKMLNEFLKMTSVIVSHDVKEAASIADYVYIISNGKVIGYGAPDEMDKTKSANVKQFLHGLPDGPVPFHYPCVDFVKDLLDGGEL
jgi:phospholipid/cholesterol/gamma-HCH transport system ATP-binding protein